VWEKNPLSEKKKESPLLNRKNLNGGKGYLSISGTGHVLSGEEKSTIFKDKKKRQGVLEEGRL